MRRHYSIRRSGEIEEPNAYYGGEGRPDAQEYHSGKKHEDKIKQIIPEPGVQPLLDKIDSGQLLFPEFVE